MENRPLIIAAGDFVFQSTTVLVASIKMKFNNFQTTVSLTVVKNLFLLFGNQRKTAYVCVIKVE